MVVRGLVRRVVRGVVRRVVRGVGSVGSPRSGGQFFQLSRINNRVLKLLTYLLRALFTANCFHYELFNFTSKQTSPTEAYGT